MVIKKAPKGKLSFSVSVSTQAGWLLVGSFMCHFSRMLTEGGPSQKGSGWTCVCFDLITCLGPDLQDVYFAFHPGVPPYSDSQGGRLRRCWLSASHPSEIGACKWHLGGLSEDGSTVLCSRPSASHCHGSGLAYALLRMWSS